MENKIKKKNFAVTLVVLVSLLVVSFGCSLFLGAQKISLTDIFSASQNVSKTIFFKLRLPRTILVLITGILLSGAGVVFQMFFRNPLAEPGIMGITSGASLGAVIAACFGGGAVLGGTITLLNAGAFLGALGAALLVCAIAFKGGRKFSTVMVLLCGTALGSLYSAITSIILTIHDRQLHSIYVWMLGSFNGRGWGEVKMMLLPALLSIILMISCLGELDLLSGGEATAGSLGVNVGRLRMRVILAGAFGMAAAVCAGGTIGFVGLIAPHVMRQICSAKGKKLLPLSMLFGAVLLLAADTLCRTVIAPSEIPVGTVTAILGVPFFISLLVSKGGIKNAS